MEPVKNRILAMVVGVAAGLSLWGLLSLSAEAQVDCSGIVAPLEKARCARGNMQATGALNPANVNARQSSVPQYGGSGGCTTADCAGATQSGYYSNTGDVGALNAAGSGALATDPQAANVQQMSVDSAGWNLSTSAPVSTANTVASTMTPTGTDRTCTDIRVCVSWAEAPASTSTCTRPGSAMSPCKVTVATTLRTVMYTDTTTTFPIGVSGWSTPNDVYVNVTALGGDRYEARVGRGHGGVWGWYGGYIFTVPSPSLGPNETIVSGGVVVRMTVAETSGTGCGSWSGDVPSGTTLFVLNCVARGDQFGWGRVEGVRAAWTIRQDIVSDGCAGFRTSGWVQQTSICNDSAPRTLTSDTGVVLTIPPPAGAPALSCWDRDEQWGYQGTVADTCAPLLSTGGCQETNSVCSVPLPGGCDTYTVTVSCPAGTICTQENVVQQCTSCGAPGSLVPYCTDTSTPPNTNFQQAATMMALIKEVQDGFDKDALRIFTGTPKRCDYSKLGTIFIDCCANDPDRLLGSCNAEELSLANDKKAKQTIFVGSRCVDRVLGICTRSEDTYCTFTSMLGRMVQQQGKPQLGLNFGTADLPNCDGFTITQFASLNFQAMDWSEFFSQVTSSFDQSAVAARVRTQACAFSGTTC